MTSSTNTESRLAELMLCLSTANLPVEAGDARATEDLLEAAQVEVDELLASALELGDADRLIGQATRILREAGAVDSVQMLHQVTQAFVEEYTGGARGWEVSRLVVLPVKVRLAPAESEALLELDKQVVDQLQAELVKSFGLPGTAELAIAPRLYSLGETLSATYDQLYSLLPAVLKSAARSENNGGALPDERLSLGGSCASREFGGGREKLAYLIGVLSTAVETDQAFYEAPREAFGMPQTRKSVTEHVTRALVGRGQCVQEYGLAPFFEGLTLGEVFFREAQFREQVEVALAAVNAVPRAAIAELRVPEAEDAADESIKVAVHLKGMDNLELACAHWELLQHEEPDVEMARLTAALKRMGVRGAREPGRVAGFGRA